MYYSIIFLFWCYQSSRALEILQEINVSSLRKSKLSEVALQKLLDNSLSLKYSLTGHLSPTDITTDGFYDPGQVLNVVNNTSLILELPQINYFVCL